MLNYFRFWFFFYEYISFYFLNAVVFFFSSSFSLRCRYMLTEIASLLYHAGCLKKKKSCRVREETVVSVDWSWLSRTENVDAFNPLKFNYCWSRRSFWSYIWDPVTNSNRNFIFAIPIKNYERLAKCTVSDYRKTTCMLSTPPKSKLHSLPRWECWTAIDCHQISKAYWKRTTFLNS
jgi:hypothetical protein